MSEDYVITWDENSEDGRPPHVFEHGYSEEEIFSVFGNSDWVPTTTQGRSGTTYVFGQTSADRYTFMVAIETADGKLKLISVRDMTSTERRRYKEHRRKRYVQDWTELSERGREENS